MNLGNDGIVAAAVLMRFAANYERAREGAEIEPIPENGVGPGAAD
jgi:hypothetical protein